MARNGLFVEREQGVGAGIDFTDPNSPVAKYYLQLGHCAFAVLLALIFILLNFTPLWHTDIWAHLRFGERFHLTKAFPIGEPFTPYGDKSVGPIYTAWLGQAVYAQVYRIGAWFAPEDHLRQLANGTDALRFFHAILVTARLALLYWAFVRLSKSSVLGTLGVLTIVVISLGNSAIARPQVFGELMFAAILVPLSRPSFSWRGVIAIPLLIALWANLHGSYPMAFLTLGGIFFGRCVTLWRLGSPIISDIGLRRLVITTIASVAAVAILNPEGPAIFVSTAKMASNPNVAMMDEWQPIWSPLAKGAQITLGLCVALIAVTMLIYRGTLNAEHWFLIALFGFGAVSHQRGMVWFITLAAWIVMPYWGEILARSRPAWWFSTPSLRKTMFAACVGVFAIVWSIPVQRLMNKEPVAPAGIMSEGTPWRLALAVRDPGLSPDTPLAQQLKSHYPGGKFAGAIFPTEKLGDFFVWESPNTPVTMYTHVHLFSPEQWRRHLSVLGAGAKWREILDQDNVNLVVLTAEDNKSLRKRLQEDKDWVIVLDETGDTSKRDPRCRLFAALRKQPR